MKSKTVELLLSELGVTKSFSRPYTPNDNPFSESQFKTVKTRPDYPDRFGCLEDAKTFCQTFFEWYNEEHYHSSIALMTPAVVHYGLAKECSKNRQEVLDMAFAANPERFVNGLPKTLVLPEKAWINPPKRTDNDDSVVATTGNGTVISRIPVSVR
jgi:putative transposase